MLSIENLERLSKKLQTDFENTGREYCQHLFLSWLYQDPRASHLLFKGGTALRILFGSPRFSEDLDFTSAGMSRGAIEDLFTLTLARIERTGVEVDLLEGKRTTGGYLGAASFNMVGLKIKIQIEVSLRVTRVGRGVRSLIVNDFVPAYTVVHLPTDEIVREKFEALVARRKPRDFYDYFFMLSGDFPRARETDRLKRALKLLNKSRIDFRRELQKLLPVSHSHYLRSFRQVLEDKIKTYL